jgi:YbbR domain-containing protein
MTEQFSSRIKVQRIMPDTIFLNFNRKVSKRVPVKANINLTIDSQYQQSDSIRLLPDHIQVSGAADVLEKIKFIETVPVTVKNLNESRTLVLDIAKNSNAGYIETNFSQVKAQINVKKYTEASVELTIEAINLPPGYSLKSFPDKVQVKYNVAFDNYQNINASQFRAVIDYKKAEPSSNKLKIVLEKFPEGIRSIKLNPEKVEFIIKK